MKKRKADLLYKLGKRHSSASFNRVRLSNAIVSGVQLFYEALASRLTNWLCLQSLLQPSDSYRTWACPDRDQHDRAIYDSQQACRHAYVLRRQVRWGSC